MTPADNPNFDPYGHAVTHMFNVAGMVAIFAVVGIWVVVHRRTLPESFRALFQRWRS
jgi:hypothetical protein